MKYQNISIIAAMNKQGVIGKEGTIPWYYATDMSRFRRLTWGKTLIMGRKTWDSLSTKPLFGRKNVVLSRQALELPPEVRLASSRAQAIEGEQGEIMVAGGSEIYRLFMPMASRMYLTLVDKKCTGDTYFPQWFKSQWVTIYAEEEPEAYKFFVLERPWKAYHEYLAHHDAFPGPDYPEHSFAESEVE